MDIQVVFAGNMKKYRKQAGFTQERLAELCDTDHRYIGQIETGRRCPSLDFVERIACALNIAPYRLFYDDLDALDNPVPRLCAEQKLKLKILLKENLSKFCNIIDNLE